MDTFKKKRQRLVIARYRRKAKSILIEYKGGKCYYCGYNKCQTSLHFHHLDPGSKDFAISHNGDANINKLKNEVDKCILICSNCHGEIHDKEYVENLNKLEEETKVHPRNFGFRKCAVCKNTFKVEVSNNERKCKNCQLSKVIVLKNKPNLSIEELSTKTSREISEKYNCSPKYIERKRKELGVKFILQKINWPSKEKLLELVWSKPLIYLAKDLGITDNAIKKHCKKNGIATPPSGYWLKQQYWKTVKK